jgi:hypothetical protein
MKAENEMKLSAVHGKPHKYKIPKDPLNKEEKEIILLLPETVDPNDYEVFKKPRPAGIPNDWNGKPVRWINCFGVKKGRAWANLEYLIIVAPMKDKILVYLDGKKIVEFADSDLIVDPPDYPKMLAAKLRIGDPPVGWGTR